MKRAILLTITLLYSSPAVFCKGVDENNARQVAENFYKQTTGNTVTLSLVAECVITDSVTHSNIPVYYAFNAGNNTGFVLVSGDDLIKPILGYGTTGAFSLAGAPPVITNWLNKYIKQINWVETTAPSASPIITSQWNNYYNNLPANQSRSSQIGPFLTTTWDQDLYYNDMCPADPSSPTGFGGDVPTGCGATAMAQIMRYWSYPTQGTGGNSYNSAYGTLSADFGTTTYNWANMPNSVTSSNADVATLMFDCGVAVDMDYEAAESLSYLLTSDNPGASCQSAYINYFGYDISTLRGLRRSDYDETYWINAIQSELNNGRPIQYSGQGPQGGHTWVLDGTDANGNFHMNWGWGGTDNGYYSIDAIDPDEDDGLSFNLGEEMIVGIQPATIAPDTSDLQLYTAITVTPNPITFLQTFSVNAGIINDGAAAFAGYYCAALFDSNGTFIRYIGPVLNTGNQPLPAGDHYTNGITFDDTAHSVTVPGTYIIAIYYQPAGANTWTLAGTDSYANPVYATISGPADAISLYSNIVASPDKLVQGEQATVRVNLVNNGTATYYGQYEAVLLDLEGNFVEQINTYSESGGLTANSAYTAPLNFTTGNITAAEGRYILAIAENPSGSSSWYYCGGQTYPNPVLIDVVNTAITSVNNVSVNRLNLYPNPAHNTIKIDAGEMTGRYELKIFNAIGEQVNESTGILNGQKFPVDVSGLPSGIYMLQLKTETGVMVGKFIVR